MGQITEHEQEVITSWVSAAEKDIRAEAEHKLFIVMEVGKLSKPRANRK
jgi:hypothetical protein